MKRDIEMSFYTNEFYDGQQGGSLASAQNVVPYIKEMINPKSVVDVGCGVGTWLSVFKSCGVNQIQGIDGDYVDKNMLLISSDEFIAQNLEKPFQFDKAYDLAVSLEVAEHLPEECAATFVELLIKLSPVILFSAAIPGQTGENHINEQWPDYWEEKFKSFDYVVVDCLRGKFWDNSKVEVWYKQNMMLYVRKDCLSRYEILENYYNKCLFAPLSIVHPDNFSQRSEMALSRPWATLLYYYSNAIAEFLKKVLPKNIAIKLKNLKKIMLS